VAAAVVIGIGVTFGGVALFDDDVPERRPEGPDLVVNGTFDNSGEQPDNKTGLSRWWVHEAQVRADGGLAQVAVPGGTKQAWGVMFGQSGVTVAKGKRYVLRFTAWTDKAAKIAVRVQSEKPPYTHALHQDFALNPAQKRFDHPFTAAHSTGSSGQVVFQLGGSTEDYTIYLDDVALVEQTS
jgi:endoglucanase